MATTPAASASSAAAAAAAAGAERTPISDFSYCLSSELDIAVRFKVGSVEGFRPKIPLSRVLDDPFLRAAAPLESELEGSAAAQVGVGADSAAGALGGGAAGSMGASAGAGSMASAGGAPGVVAGIGGGFDAAAAGSAGSVGCHVFVSCQAFADNKPLALPMRTGFISVQGNLTEGDGAYPTSTPPKSGPSTEMDRIEKLMRKFERGDIPHVDWMDRLAAQEIKKIGRMEAKTHRNMHLYIELPQFDFPVVFNEKEYLLPPNITLRQFGFDVVPIFDPEHFNDNPIENKHRKLARSHRNGPLDRELKPNAKLRDDLNKILRYPPTKTLTTEEKDLLWKFRFYLTRDKKALTKFVKCVIWTDPTEAKQAAELLSVWVDIDVEDALELLGPAFQDSHVRSYAVIQLKKADDEELQLYLLQLVQALKFERLEEQLNILDSPLVEFLIDRGIRNQVLGNYLHWYLMVECENKIVGKTYAKVAFQFMTAMIEAEKASMFKSALLPLHLTFSCLDGSEYAIMFKTGDDLRQDQLVVQIIMLMDRLLRKENLDLKLTPYKVLATGTDHAGYCVITYLLGIGDRHLDNLLLTREGNMIHIDFGFMLGRDPKPFPPPMKLCKEMVEAMGGTASPGYQKFKSYAFIAFNSLRKSANLILNLFSLMVNANIPDIAIEPDKAVWKVQERFRLDLNDEEAIQFFQALLIESIGAFFPQVMEQLHKVAQLSEYDRGVNTFSPEGRLFQVEYAIEAIKLGSTAIGIQTSKGVVLAVEKRVTSTLLESSSIEKIMEIDVHLGCAMSGLIADSRTMIDHARVEAQNHTFVYNERIKVESAAQAVCDLALRFGESADGEEALMSRPFGIALLIAGVDEKGPQLYHADPSGTLTRYDAKAIGSGSEGAQTELQEQFHRSLTLDEAISLSLKVLKQVMEEKISASNVQVATVTPEHGFRIIPEAELVNVVANLS
nr:Phosphatidylinositol (PI) 3-kinase [Polyrhizophydium stewartii]